MDVTAYFADLSAEFRAVQNRIRQLIGPVHWPSDGAWKESVIRSALRGYLPSSISVGSGFVLTDEGPSTQVDILIYDDSAPILFRDGDFVVVTSDSVRGVIEVKTKLNRTSLRKALQKLDGVAAHVRKSNVAAFPFYGLFSFEPVNVSPEMVLEELRAANSKTGIPPITALCFGDSQFYRFWEFRPGHKLGQVYDTWHAYDLPRLAPGYFIHNVIDRLFPHAVARAGSVFFPENGKEPGRVATLGRRIG